MSGTHTTIIDFMRHGEPVGGRKYRGQIDDPLSEKGWGQMWAAVSGDAPWQVIVSSPLIRCRAFAEALAQDRGLPLTLEPRLQEVAFGVWEGKTAAEITAQDPGRVFNFKRDPVAWRPESAESLKDFRARVSEAFENLAQTYAGQHVLVVAHAGVLRMAMCHVLGLTEAHAYRLQIGSAAMARFKLESRAGDRLDQLLWLTPGPGKA